MTIERKTNATPIARATIRRIRPKAEPRSRLELAAFI